MNNKQLFEKISTLLVRLKDYRTTGKLKFESMEEKTSIRDIFRKIAPGVFIDLGCGMCVVNLLHQLLSYYEREYPKWIATQETAGSIQDEDIVKAAIIQDQEEKKKGYEETKLTRAEILKLARKAKAKKNQTK